MESLHVVEVEVSLGNRYVVLASPPDLTLEEAQRVAKYFSHHGITNIIRRVEWKDAAKSSDASYL
jgi:hypothetical protein